MIYKKLGKTGVDVSIIAMGGHEYLPDGRSRGFNEDFNLAVKPGHLFDGFGAEIRKKVLAIAFDHCINLFDVTQDSEKEALGRNLKEMPPPSVLEDLTLTDDDRNILEKIKTSQLLKTLQQAAGNLPPTRNAYNFRFARLPRSKLRGMRSLFRFNTYERQKLQEFYHTE